MAPTTIAAIGPLAAVAVPAAFATALFVRRGSPRERGAIAVAGVALTAAIVAGLAVAHLAGQTLRYVGGEIAPGVPIALVVDGLGLALAAIVAGASLVVVPVIVRTREGAADSRPPAAALLASLAAAIGVGLAGNLLVLVAFLVALTLAVYPLVASGGDRAARHAGYTTVAYGLAGALIVLGGTRVIYAATGTVAFEPGGILGIADADAWLVRSAMWLFVVGLGTFAALVPFHSWILRARVAPTPIVGVSYAIVVVKAGAFGLLRVHRDVVGPDGFATLGGASVLLVLAAATVVLGGVLAVASPALRTRLVYLAIAGGAVAPLAIAVDGSATALVAAYLVGHAAALLAGFLALDRLERADGMARRATAVLGFAAAALVALVAAVAAVATVGAAVDPTAPGAITVAALAAGVLTHALALRTAVAGALPPDGRRRLASTATDRQPVATGVAVLDRPVRAIHAGANAVGERADRSGVAAMRAARDPGVAIEAALPARYAPRYGAYRRKALGETGTKLGVDASVYVLAIVLAGLLVLALA